MALPNASATPAKSSLSKCPYRSGVMAAVACPKKLLHDPDISARADREGGRGIPHWSKTMVCSNDLYPCVDYESAADSGG